MANGEPNGWRMATVILTASLAAFAAMWGMIEVHAGNPHKSAATQGQYDALTRRLDRIESKVDQLMVR